MISHRTVLATLCAILATIVAGDVSSAETAKSISEARQQRHEAAHRNRRLVFHSDGVAMDPKYAYHEPTPSVIPHLPGTQTDACTYSLVHQFPIVRLYRSKVGQEWPEGITEKLFKDGPDGLDQYIEFCRKNDYEAFWAMRTNDTHDAGRDEHGQNRWNSNLWKQAHPELLFGSREKLPPFGGWSALDFAQQPVREKFYDLVAEVSQNYPVDGVVLDFFRHLPTFKSTGWGANEASDEERAALTDVLRRLRDKRDKTGAEQGRPVLLAVRTPDTPEYCRALGLDIETWMKEGLIDIWIATGYFRLDEWENIAAFGHKYDIPVWASIDESRVMGRDNRNDLAAYRARVMNAWRGGVDTIWIFNYFYFPKDAHFSLLNEAADIETLALTDKVYFPDGRGQDMAWRYLKDGSSYYKRARAFDPQFPEKLKPGQSRIVELRIGDDLSVAARHNRTVNLTLSLRADDVPDDLKVAVNDAALERVAKRDGWIDFKVQPEQVKLGLNLVEIGLSDDSAGEPKLNDLQLAINYLPKAAE
jgi:hypothetical protein